MVLMSSCSGRTPVQPGSAAGIGQQGADQRVGDLGGGGSTCDEQRGDPGCAHPRVTIQTPDGSALSISCEVHLVSPLTAHPIGLSDCGVVTATGRFEGVTLFNWVGTTPLRLFEITASTVEVQLGFDWPIASKYITEGTLAATIGTVVTGTTCDPGQPILAVDFQGVLPRIGAVSGTIAAACPAS
jgi:hypothetical protein